MKKIVLLILLVVSYLSHNAQVNIQWEKRYNGGSGKVDNAEDMCVDASGNVYVTGVGRGTSGTDDYITIKYNAAGGLVWKVEYNGTGNGIDDAHAITVDAAGNVYVTGWSYSGVATGFDIVTLKYNSSGTQVWASPSKYTGVLSGGTDEATDIAVDNAGNVFVSGYSEVKPSSTRFTVAMIIRYDATGIQTYAIPNAIVNYDAFAYALFVNKTTGEAYIAGSYNTGGPSDYDYFVIKYNLAGAQQWAGTYDGPDSKYDEARAIYVDASGNVYITGYSQTNDITNYDYATVKYSSAGAKIWSRRYNGTATDINLADDRANAIVVDASGYVFVTGKSVGVGTAAHDVVTIKYSNNATGTPLDTVRYNSPDNGLDEGKAIAIDAAGDVYVTGSSNSASIGLDYLTIKYDKNLNLKWLTKYNGIGNNADKAVAIAVDAIGNVFVAGTSKGSGSDYEDFETIKYCQLTANAGRDTSVCIGSTLQLNASAPGAISFAWTADPTLSNTGIANPTVNTSIADTTSYFVAITNANGCIDLDTVTVIVVPFPTPTISKTGTICADGSGSVTLTSTSAASYLWNTASASQSITVSTVGTYTITVKNSTGCSGTATKLVSASPLPSIDASPNDSTCLSKNITLLATGGVSYLWSPPGLFSDSSSNSPSVGPTVNTMYKVIGTDTFGCKNTDSVKITVIDNPGLPTFSFVYDTLKCDSIYFSYQWYHDFQPIPNETKQYYKMSTVGNYFVKVSNELGCSSFSIDTNIVFINKKDSTVVSGTGVSENGKVSSFSLYPNPTSDKITLDFISNNHGVSKINLMNISGQIIFSEDISPYSGAFRKDISFSEKPSGVYFLQVITDDDVFIKKIIKQ